jgi:hypothetical protein
VISRSFEVIYIALTIEATFFFVFSAKKIYPLASGVLKRPNNFLLIQQKKHKKPKRETKHLIDRFYNSK